MYKTTMKDVYECVERLGKYYAVYSSCPDLAGYTYTDCMRSAWSTGFDSNDLPDVLDAIAISINDEIDADECDNYLVGSDCVDFLKDYVCDGGEDIDYFKVGLYALKEVDLYTGSTDGLTEKSFEAISRFFSDIMMQVADLCSDENRLKTDEVFIKLEVPYVFESATAKALMEDFQDIGYAEDEYETAFEEIESNISGEYSDATKRCILLMFNNVMYKYDDISNDVYMLVNTITDELNNSDFYEDNNCEVRKEKGRER